METAQRHAQTGTSALKVGPLYLIKNRLPMAALITVMFGRYPNPVVLSVTCGDETYLIRIESFDYQGQNLQLGFTGLIAGTDIKVNGQFYGETAGSFRVTPDDSTPA